MIRGSNDWILVGMLIVILSALATYGVLIFISIMAIKRDHAERQKQQMFVIWLTHALRFTTYPDCD